MIKKLMLFVFLTASSSTGETPCETEARLAVEVREGLEHLRDMRMLLQQTCREKALAKECARQRIEFRAFAAELSALEEERISAESACKASPKTIRSNSPN